jgi:hypothetical protein
VGYTVRTAGRKGASEVTAATVTDQRDAPSVGVSRTTTTANKLQLRPGGKTSTPAPHFPTPALVGRAA